MRALSNWALARRVVMESIVWIAIFFAVLGLILLFTGVIENPEDLKTFLGTGRTT